MDGYGCAQFEVDLIAKIVVCAISDEFGVLDWTVIDKGTSLL